MATRSRQLDADIEAEVRERLKPNECVQSWSKLFTVFLIDKDLHSICKERPGRSGRGAGMGRTLSFRFEHGVWSFVGVGGWIS